MELRVAAWGAIVAFGLTAAFIVWPNPCLIALFVFFSQSLFVIVAFLSLRRVLR